MNFDKALKKLISLKNQNQPLTYSTWPKELYFDSSLVSKLKDLESFTNKEYFLISKQKGSIGWEYGINGYFLVDTMYFSKPISGNYSSVSTNQRIQVKTKYDKDKKVYFELVLDDQVQKSKKYDPDSLGELFLKHVVTFHTHPKYYHDANTFQYTFFSMNDILYLLQTNILVLGLIAGNTIWLACKSSSSKLIPETKLREVTDLELNGGSKKMIQYIKTNLVEYDIMFYYGSFGGILKKL